LSSGPALADPGLSSLVTGITGPLPPALTEPVDEVGATVDPALDPALDQVQGQVDAATASVDETVDQTTGLVDATVSGAAPVVEQTVENTLGAAGDTLDTLGGGTSAPPSVLPPSASADARAADASPTSTDQAARGQAPTAIPTGSAVPPAQLESAVLSGETEPAALLRSGGTRLATTRPSGGSPTLSETTIPAVRLASGADAPTAADRPHQVLAGDAARAPENRPARPLPLPDGDSLLFGWLPSEPPPAAPLLAALLGLLALAAPLAGGRRLHPAVALLRPADVRFRLVRPG
jgi:hypothetical protein